MNGEKTREAYFVNSFKVRNLWGFRNLSLSFKRDVNIITGLNGSGKTTVLNLLYYVLNGDIHDLIDVRFEEILIGLSSIKDSGEETIKVTCSEKEITFQVSRHSFKFPREPLFSHYSLLQRKQYLATSERELSTVLGNLVSVAWLPVSRRLPVGDEEDHDYRTVTRYSRTSESVDMRLRGLLADLRGYRLRLEVKLSELYKEFEKQVLQVVLYSKQHDRVESLTAAAPTTRDKEQLMRAFNAAGLLDNEMRQRIDEHFSAADAAAKRLSAGTTTRGFKVDDVLVIPLIGRTKSMVQFSQKLEEDRAQLFSPLERFMKILNSFLSDKSIKVEDNGTLIVHSGQGQDLDSLVLSSGEKQLLILLVQALVWEDRPVIYVADEPELSLHVGWQEKLLKSIIDLASQIQIIVATHSPDMVGPFVDNVIELSSGG